MRIGLPAYSSAVLRPGPSLEPCVLRSLRTKPLQATPFQQTTIRGLHLLHHIFAEFASEKLTDVRKKPIPPANKVGLNLYASDSKKIGPMTLANALPLIKPYTHLSPFQEEPAASNFQIKPLKSVSRQKSPRAEKRTFKRAGRSKEFHLTTDCSLTYLRHVLSTAYDFLLQGARIEFVLHEKYKNVRDGVGPDVALEHCSHLRPDTILRAMPEGTIMLAHPCIVQEMQSQNAKGDGSAPPLMWALEHEPSMRRFEPTPKWIKKMAAWNLELQLDPALGSQQSVQLMFEHSIKRRKASVNRMKALAQGKRPKSTSQRPNWQANVPAWPTNARKAKTTSKEIRHKSDPSIRPRTPTNDYLGVRDASRYKEHVSSNAIADTAAHVRIRRHPIISNAKSRYQNNTVKTQAHGVESSTSQKRR